MKNMSTHELKKKIKEIDRQIDIERFKLQFYHQEILDRVNFLKTSKDIINHFFVRINRFLNKPKSA